MVDDAQIQSGLAALILPGGALQLVLAAGHLHEPGVGMDQDAVQIGHLDIGFQPDLLPAAEGASGGGSKAPTHCHRSTSSARWAAAVR